MINNVFYTDILTYDTINKWIRQNYPQYTKTEIAEIMVEFKYKWGGVYMVTFKDKNMLMTLMMIFGEYLHPYPTKNTEKYD